MFEIKERPKMVERALLVGVATPHEDRVEAESLLEELAELTSTLGVPVVGKILVTIREVSARLLVGSGKADEIVIRARDLKADVIIFDHELTPGQQRNWEALSKLAVIDRQEVIIDIFAKRAQTKEARLQVDLARLEYSLPRLKRAWGHLGQQAGGIGGKGEGEAQIELDRRMIRAQIDRLRKDLELVRTRRATQRKDRRKVPVPNAAIVGYTNAGKSSLLRRLTGANVLVEDKLFATLDTTTRRIDLPNNQPLLLTDTVGFIRKLPHRLVEAFHATLEESVIADFLIHLLDASHPQVVDFHSTTIAVLRELGADEKRTLTVFNKIDRVTDHTVIQQLRLQYPEALFVSTLTGEGIPLLVQAMARLLNDRLQFLRVHLPHDRGDLIASLHRDAEIDSARYTASGLEAEVRLPRRLAARYEAFVQSHPSAEEEPTVRFPLPQNEEPAVAQGF